jgi:hypothetical protein
MTSQQRIERMSRIMKQQNHRPEQMMRFRHTMTLVSPRHHDNNIMWYISAFNSNTHSGSFLENEQKGSRGEVSAF